LQEGRVEELENCLRCQELELDRKLTQQAKQHELQTQVGASPARQQPCTVVILGTNHSPAAAAAACAHRLARAGPAAPPPLGRLPACLPACLPCHAMQLMGCARA
jgi:hypothetical protein